MSSAYVSLQIFTAYESKQARQAMQAINAAQPRKKTYTVTSTSGSRFEWCFIEERMDFAVTKQSHLLYMLVETWRETYFWQGVLLWKLKTLASFYMRSRRNWWIYVVLFQGVKWACMSLVYTLYARLIVRGLFKRLSTRGGLLDDRCIVLVLTETIGWGCCKTAAWRYISY